MEVSFSATTTRAFQSYHASKKVEEERPKLSGKHISEEYLKEYMAESLQTSQTNLFEQGALFQKVFGGEEARAWLKEIGYEGTPIADLEPEEAKALIAEDGFFGIQQTSERMANFVLMGAGENEKLLRAGREGMIRGFEEAEALWGEKLPEISYETLQKALAMIDERMKELGYSTLSESA